MKWKRHIYYCPDCTTMLYIYTDRKGNIKRFIKAKEKEDISQECITSISVD